MNKFTENIFPQMMQVPHIHGIKHDIFELSSEHQPIMGTHNG